jgi:hypothetical protein
MRKLLPYEQHLIEALGITEEEYWQFYLARLNYKDEKQGTVLDVRNDAGVVALVLTIVGTLAQVGAALLAPKPEPPSQTMGRRTRNTFFAPRYGFNSFQEVARYGDPVNLVYTNISENTAGGVRVNTSLVWSAVHSLGSRQFMQMLTVVGAGPIEEFGYGRTAFGQTPLRDIPAQRFWLYAQPEGGRLAFLHNRYPEPLNSDDPSREGIAPSEAVYKVNTSGLSRPEGFSQAFSPTTTSSLGLYDVVPINVQVEDRDDKGKEDRDRLGTNLTGRGTYWPDTWPTLGVRPILPVDSTLTLIFREDDGKKIDEDVERAAVDLRSSYITIFDSSSLYKIGAAKFKMISSSIQNGSDVQGQFTFRCVEAGVLCEEDYKTLNYQENGQELRAKKREIEALIAQLNIEYGEAFASKVKGSTATQIDAYQDRLQQLDENILNASAVRRGNMSVQDFTDLLDGTGAFADANNQINDWETDIRERNRIIDNLREQLDEIDSSIQDILAERPFNDAQRNRIRKLKERRGDLRESIRDQTTAKKESRNNINNIARRLMPRAIEEGLFDGSPRTDLKTELREMRSERRQIRRAIDALVDDKRDTSAETAAQQDWRQRYDAAQKQLTETNAALNNQDNWNDYFNTKCIAKIDEIGYETVTRCDIVNFCFKSKIFQRIQGRQSKYAETDMQGHKDSDNGVRNRTSLFWMLYKKPTDARYTRAKYILAIRNGKEVDIYTHLRFIAGSKEKWQFKFEPILDLPAELRTHNDGANIDILYLRTFGYGLNDEQQTLSLGSGHSLVFRGKRRQTVRLRPSLNRTPKFVDEWGLFSLRSDTQTSFSFDSGPENTLAAVTEQQLQAFSSGLYQDLVLLGLNIYSGQGVQDLRSLSAWVTKGKKVRKLSDGGAYGSSLSASTSFAPEIFLDTILDEKNGIGAYANPNGIDTVRLGEAQKFCRANGYYMDGVIAQPQSWREFWSTVAPFSLLEFARIGGKETLVPAVPCDIYGRVTSDISISALFNQGNILEDSYKEEFIDYGDNTQDLIATIVYRNTENDNVFPGNTSVTIALADSVESESVRQSFDLSDFVSRRSQALHYGMLLCQQRRWSRRAVEFKTFPTESPIEPGSYIYVQTDQNQWDDFRSGIIEAFGALNTPLAEDPISGSYTALLYSGNPDDGVVRLASVSVANSKSSSFAPYKGWLFVLGTALTTKRVFRVTEVTMEEEGEITVRAIEHPCEETSGRTLSKIVRFDPGLFKID